MLESLLVSTHRRGRRGAAALLLALLLPGLVAACGSAAPRPTPVSDAQAFASLVERYWEEQLAMDPLMATSIGDERYNDRLANTLSPAYRATTRAMIARYMAELADIDRSRLSRQDRLSYDVLRTELDHAQGGMRFPSWLVPLDQRHSLPTFFAMMGSGDSIQPFRNARDYDHFLARMDDMAVWIDQAIVNMREGVASGVVQPQVAMRKVLPQLAAHLVERPQDSIFWEPIASLPATSSEAERDRLTSAYETKIAQVLVPAYRRLHDFIRDEYIPACRESVAISALPDGPAWYAYAVEVGTTKALDPHAIHELGLAQVAHIRGEMEAVMRQVGFQGDLQAFFAHVQRDDRYFFDSEEQLLAAYRALQTRINTLLPAYFDIFPRSDYQIRPVEAFRAQSAAGASYQPGTPDGSRPGIFYLNTYNLRAQPIYGTETLSLHEASPGHHFQISIQQELAALPAFRRFGGYNAYVEGWALYAESIGKELGLFTDPMQYYGKLSDEMLRAMRLVVDTGLHSLGWSREQAIQYMHENSSLAATDIVAEVERYIVSPGQALGYKIGQLTILALRREAQEALGEHFDIKAFHRQVLQDGALPLSVLEAKIRAWIAAQG